MTQLLILALFAIIGLLVLMAFLVLRYQRQEIELVGQFNYEREQWRNERRFLIDRAIAQHVGEVIALEREDHRKAGSAEAPRENVRPLIEGLH